MNAEFKRMMKLAGLTEIAIKVPGKSIKLNLPYDLLRDSSTIIPNEDLEEEYDKLLNGLIELNPQINPYFFQNDNDGLFNDVMNESNGEDLTVLEFCKLYFTWLFANLIADFNRYEGEEIPDREDKFLNYQNDFVDNAIKGYWLKIKGVTED